MMPLLMMPMMQTPLPINKRDNIVDISDDQGEGVLTNITVELLNYDDNSRLLEPTQINIKADTSQILEEKS